AARAAPHAVVRRLVERPIVDALAEPPGTPATRRRDRRAIVDDPIDALEPMGERLVVLSREEKLAGEVLTGLHGPHRAFDLGGDGLEPRSERPERAKDAGQLIVEARIAHELAERAFAALDLPEDLEHRLHERGGVRADLLSGDGIEKRHVLDGNLASRTKPGLRRGPHRHPDGIVAEETF